MGLSNIYSLTSSWVDCEAYVSSQVLLEPLSTFRALRRGVKVEA